jgi:parvulin-like peptidyl-prolyl isomerase
MIASRRLAVTAAFLLPLASCLLGQVLLDRVIARVESDVILLSEVRTLSRYQDLVDGKKEADSQILDRLIDQWIVRNEADTARFPHPTDVEVARGLERLLAAFDSLDEYQARKKTVGLSDADVQKMISDQLYLSKYLDSRFRPAVQVTPAEIEDFYQKGVVARAKARRQQPPTLEASREYIQEALIQRGINEQADRWLQESRARVHVQKFLDEGGK